MRQGLDPERTRTPSKAEDQPIDENNVEVYDDSLASLFAHWGRFGIGLGSLSRWVFAQLIAQLDRVRQVAVVGPESVVGRNRRSRLPPEGRGPGVRVRTHSVLFHAGLAPLGFHREKADPACALNGALCARAA